MCEYMGYCYYGNAYMKYKNSKMLLYQGFIWFSQKGMMHGFK